MNNNNISILDAITFHHYYGNSEKITQNKYINVTILDSLMTRLEEVVNITHDNVDYPMFNNIPLILGVYLSISDNVHACLV